MSPVVCVIATLGAGGAERAMSWLAATLAQERPVVVVTFDAGDAPPFYPLPAAVGRIALDVIGHSGSKASAVGRMLTTWWRLRRAIRGTPPGPVVAFVDRTNVMTVLACAGLRRRVVVSERCDPVLASPGPFWAWMRRVLYRFADTVVVQTPWTGERLASLGVRATVAVIPNPVAEVPESGATRRTVVLGVGRFEPQKGFDLLLRAFARARPTLGPAWRLRLVGAGPDDSELRALAGTLGVADAVEWPGRVSHVAAEYDAASVFVLASRFEGFPNALAEAMAAGTACIATDCPTGPRDLITPGVDGYLVEVDDADGLSRALVDLCQNASVRQRLGTAARQSMRRFDGRAIAQQWRDVIDGSTPGCRVQQGASPRGDACAG